MARPIEVKTREGFLRLIAAAKAARADYDRLEKQARRSDLDGDIQAIVKGKATDAFAVANKAELKVISWAVEAMTSGSAKFDLKAFAPLADSFPTEALVEAPAKA